MVLNIYAPCGRIKSYALIESGDIKEIYFDGVPSFRIGNGFEVQIDSWGSIKYELAYGGAFYAFVNSDQFDLKLNPGNYQQIISLGQLIKREVSRSNPHIQHPFEKDLSFLYGTIFVEDSTTPHVHSRNVCVFADGEVDRCPTGSGLSGRLPIHFARGELEEDQKIVVESIIGSTFSGHVKQVVRFGPHNAVIPRIGGNAYITGRHEFIIDPSDPLKHGFFLR
jgi:trans-L-3-hydroxyproline dehydratase